MAPGLLDPLLDPISSFPYPYIKALNAVDKSVFPDGFRTSGMHPAVDALIRPYEEFPKQIDGPTVWKAEDYSHNPERWVHVFSEEEIAELSQAADDFIAAGRSLTAISQDIFPLPTLSKFFGAVRKELSDGKGFILFKGIPVREWGLQKCATAYMGLGTYFGYFLSQNGRGHVLGHVKDLGEDPNTPDRVRIYRTNAKQYFHTDAGDLVGLLCIARSLEGGESDIISTHNVYNTLQREHPEVVKALVTPNWYFDRKGEVSEGMEPYYRSAILFLENDPNGSPRVYARHDPMNLWSLQRFNSGPNAVIPPLSEEQSYALKMWDETCSRLALHMILEPGDIQLLSNTHIYHARTAYKDYPPGSVDEQGVPRVRRHLMRLWLANPEDEGGWKLPYHDSKEKKRGGIQVNDTAPVCPLDAE